MLVAAGSGDVVDRVQRSTPSHRLGREPESQRGRRCIATANSLDLEICEPVEAPTVLASAAPGLDIFRLILHGVATPAHALNGMACVDEQCNAPSGITETAARTASFRRQASESPTAVVLYG